MAEDDSPGVPAVQDWARGTLQDWFQDYTSAADDPAGQGRQWRSRLLEAGAQGGTDDYRFRPAWLTSEEGRVYRVRVEVIDVTAEYQEGRA